MEIVFVSRNRGKIEEVQRLLPSYIRLLSLDDIGHKGEIAEESHTLEENSDFKASYIAQEYKVNCFADDTGLEVKALFGAPGVYSARYAGTDKNDIANMQKLLSELQGVEDRTAQFKTVITLILNNKKETFTGIVRGNITKEIIGKGGFGYDPIFEPEGFDITFAQMSIANKNKISHRAKAIQQLVSYLKRYNNA